MLQEIDPQGGQYSLEVTHLISDNTWYKPRKPDPKVQYITTKLCCLLSVTGLWEAKMNIFFHLTWGIAQNGILSGISHVNSPSPTLSAEVHSETPDSLPPAFSPWMSRRHLPLNMLRTALSSFPSKYCPVLSPRCRPHLSSDWTRCLRIIWNPASLLPPTFNYYVMYILSFK